jgi:hypothetical protein
MIQTFLDQHDAADLAERMLDEICCGFSEVERVSLEIDRKSFEHADGGVLAIYYKGAPIFVATMIRDPLNRTVLVMARNGGAR